MTPEGSRARDDIFRHMFGVKQPDAPKRVDVVHQQSRQVKATPVELPTSGDVEITCFRHEDHRETLNGQIVPRRPRYPTDKPVAISTYQEMGASGILICTEVLGLGYFEITVSWRGQKRPDIEAILRRCGFTWGDGT